MSFDTFSWNCYQGCSLAFFFIIIQKFWIYTGNSKRVILLYMITNRLSLNNAKNDTSDISGKNSEYLNKKEIPDMHASDANG